MIDKKSKDSIYEFLRFGEVTRVDYVKSQVDIKYVDSDYIDANVSFVSPQQGLNHFMGGMPEVGAMAVVGHFKLARTFHSKSGRAIVLGFISRYTFFSQFFDAINIRNDGVTDLDIILQQDRMKTWKLYPGEFLISSKQGSDIRVDKGLFLQNSAMNEIKLDPFSQVMSFLALNQTINSAAGSINFGLVHRNALLNDDEFADLFSEGTTQALSDGREFFRVTNSEKTINSPYGNQSLSDPGVLGFTEFRLEIKELADDTLDVTEESSGVDQTDRIKSDGSEDDADVTYPLVTFSLGTLIGNDAVTKEGKNLYGKVLVPVTFQTNADKIPSGIEQLAENKDGIDGEGTQAGAAQLKLPNTQTSWSLTKEGVLEYTLDSSSTNHPLGAGRSANIGLLGSAKIAIGQQALDGKSLLLDLLGGASVTIGGEATKGRSLDLLMSNGLNIEIQGSDQDRNSIRGVIQNNIDLLIKGSRYTEIRGDEITLVHGLHETRVLGKKVDNFINDKANNYGGSLKENVVGSYQSNVGSGRYVTISTPDIVNGETSADKEKIISGDKELTMLLGSYMVSLLAGKISETIEVGARSIDLSVGNFSVSVGVGNIDIGTKAGDVTIGTQAGSVTMTGLAGVNVVGPTVSLKAPLVTIGSLTQGGVVNSGPGGHRDYLTGLLLLGSSSVTCNTI